MPVWFFVPCPPLPALRLPQVVYDGHVHARTTPNPMTPAPLQQIRIRRTKLVDLDDGETTRSRNFIVIFAYTHDHRNSTRIHSRERRSRVRFRFLQYTVKMQYDFIQAWIQEGKGLRGFSQGGFGRIVYGRYLSRYQMC